MWLGDLQDLGESILGQERLTGGDPSVAGAEEGLRSKQRVTGSVWRRHLKQ